MLVAKKDTAQTERKRMSVPKSKSTIKLFVIKTKMGNPKHNEYGKPFLVLSPRKLDIPHR